MKWKPEETDIIDYLYGSMANDKKEKFEQYLESDPELKKEIDELRLTQKVLPSFQDEEVIPPVPLAGIESVKSRSLRGWLYPVSIAASVAVILLTGYLTNFRMSFNDNGFELGFVDPGQINNALTEEEVEQMIAARMNKFTSDVDGRLVSLSSDFENQLSTNQALTEAQITSIAKHRGFVEMDDEQVLQFIGQLQAENKKMMQNFYQVSAEEQKTYLRNILLEYSDYLDRQRQEDIQFIQANLRDIRSNSELKQEETDKILANIITQVNSQNSPVNNRQSLD